MVAWLIAVYVCAGVTGCPQGNVVTTYTAMQPGGGTCMQIASQMLSGQVLGDALPAEYKMIVPPTCVLAPKPSWMRNLTFPTK
jgi:hypothetical protein